MQIYPVNFDLKSLISFEFSKDMKNTLAEYMFR